MDTVKIIYLGSFNGRQKVHKAGTAKNFSLTRATSMLNIKTVATMKVETTTID
jgi:hypothetical protein